MYAKTLEQQAFFTQTKSSLSKALPQRGWELGKIKPRHPTIGGFPQPSRSGQGGQNSGEKHYHANLTRARCRVGLGLGHCRHNSPDVARTRALERLSAAAMGHRRIPCAVV